MQLQCEASGVWRMKISRRGAFRFSAMSILGAIGRIVLCRDQRVGSEMAHDDSFSFLVLHRAGFLCDLTGNRRGTGLAKADGEWVAKRRSGHSSGCLMALSVVARRVPQQPTIRKMQRRFIPRGGFKL